MNLASIHNGEILKTSATEHVTMTEFLILLHTYVNTNIRLCLLPAAAVDMYTMSCLLMDGRDKHNRNL